MIGAPVSTTPVSARWTGSTLGATPGQARAADLAAREALWTVEIAAPVGSGGPTGTMGGVLLGQPVSSYGLPTVDTGVVSRPPIRVSDRGWITEPDDADAPNQSWPARLMEPPALEMAIPIYPAESRRAEVTAGEVLLANGDGGMDALAGDWTLAGRTVVISRGPHRRPQQAYSYEVGRVAEMRVAAALDGGSQMRLTLGSAARDLNIPVCSLFEGTGGAEGPAALKGQPKPRLYGQRQNFVPVQVEPGLLTYLVHDGPTRAVLGVRNRAVEWSFAGDVANYAALAAAVVAGGTYLTCLATGHIRLGSTASSLTVSAMGDAAGGYARTPREIAVRLLTGVGGLAPNRAPGEAFSTWPAQDAGLLVTSGTVAEVMNALAAGVGGWWGADAFGQMYGSVLLAPEDQGPSVVLEPWMLMDPPEEEGLQAPWYRVRVAARILDRVQTGEDIAGLADAQRAYYGQRDQQAIEYDPSVQAMYPAAVDGGLIDSVFVDVPSAQAMAQRLLSLFSKPRRSWRVRIKAGVGGLALQQVMPGNIVSLTWPRIASLSQGKALVVRRVSARGDLLTLTLWG
jgi:hypothetical protein